MTPAGMAALHRAGFTQSRPWSEAEFAGLLATPGTFACGDARGFALVRVIADEAELLTLTTHPAHRRQGHARALMDRWQTQAAAQGAARAFLEVAADNAPALALYERAGFRRAGLRRAYYARAGGRAADAVVMTRAL